MDGYPLEWGWHTPPSSGSGEPPAWKPTPTLLGGADPDSFASDDASGSPVEIAQAPDGGLDNTLIAYQRWPATQQRELTNPAHEDRERDWRIEWRLKKPSSKGGWIVQKVDIVHPSGETTSHWEAWEVRPGKDRTTRHPVPHDTFSTSMQNGGKPLPGVYHIRSEARFHEGLQLPESFVRKNPQAQFAGELHSTHIDPNLPTENATAPFRRTWRSPDGGR